MMILNNEETKMQTAAKKEIAGQKEEFYLSVFAEFESDEVRRAWMKEHVIKHGRPHNGPIYSWSIDKESDYRDQNTELLEALEMALPYIEEGEEFNKPRIKGRDSKKIRELIAKARGAQ
jgi:hypothetical protein